MVDARHRRAHDSERCVLAELEGTEALDDLTETLSPEVQKAFGVQNLTTEAGYLDGQVYALFLPALLSGVAIAGATALTAGDEGPAGSSSCTRCR